MGGSRRFCGGLGGSRGVYSTPVRHFLPLWKSCTAPDLVPNTILWSNWTSFSDQASLTQFWTFGAPLGAPKRPFYEQIKPFWTPKYCRICHFGPLKDDQMAQMNRFLSQMSDNAQSRWSPNVKCILYPILSFLRFQNDLIYS